MLWALCAVIPVTQRSVTVLIQICIACSIKKADFFFFLQEDLNFMLILGSYGRYLPITVQVKNLWF